MSYLIDDEKCPSCGEGWINGKGLDCANNCEDKNLEEEHRTTTPLMVNHLLPNWGIKVDCPNDWEEPKEGVRIIWGRTNIVNRKIEIPWYTLRNKRMFFPTVCHETAHISTYEKKANTETKKVLKGIDNIYQEYIKLPPIVRNSSQVKSHYKIIIDNYRLKHKKTLDKWREESKKSHGGHWKEPWYSDYVDFHNNLMKSSFAKYNYHNEPPLSWEES